MIIARTLSHDADHRCWPDHARPYTSPVCCLPWATSQSSAHAAMTVKQSCAVGGTRTLHTRVAVSVCQADTARSSDEV